MRSAQQEMISSAVEICSRDEMIWSQRREKREEI
jgi:hypothetical protein